VSNEEKATSAARKAVLLLAHGTPESVEQIPEYLRNVVSGRPVSPELVCEIKRRYALIGRSPLTEITQRQAKLLERELAQDGAPVPVYVGMRNWRPYIVDAVRQMRADGVEAAAVICMAPQNSKTSVGLYRRAVEAEAGPLHIDFTVSWAAHPLLMEAFAERLRACWDAFRQEVGGQIPVLFTAHSVPIRTVQPAAEGDALTCDSYADDARMTAERVAALLPEIPYWRFAFQSQGAGGGPWLGPTVEEILESLSADGVKSLILQPVGFLCDHVEILYDIDIDFRRKAAALGIRLERPESLNESPLLTRALADLARQALARL
jgi:ferrochelatase